jgi:hypothetical protein
MPNPQNIQLHTVNRYYDGLIKLGLVRNWTFDAKNVHPSFTREGRKYIRQKKSGEFQVHCCQIDLFEVFCLTVDPSGENAQGLFRVESSKLFGALQWIATRYPVFPTGIADFKRDDTGWHVANVWVDPRIAW